MPRFPSLRMVLVTFVLSVGFSVSVPYAIDLRQITAPYPDTAPYPPDYEVFGFHAYAEPTWTASDRLLVVVRGLVAIDVYSAEQLQFLVRFDLQGTLDDWSRPPAGRIIGRASLNPNGPEMAFWYFDHLGCPGVHIYDPDYHVEEGVCLSWTTGPPAWSSDGQLIAAATSGGLVTYTPQGSAAGNLTAHAGDQQPAWSPDGAQLVYSSTRSGTRDLWITNVQSAEEDVHLTTDSEDDTWPAWSPNGSWIAYASSRGGSVDRIWAIPVIGGEPVLMADLPDACSAPAWSPSGTSMAFESGGHIWVATDLPEQIVTVEETSWSAVKSLYRDE